MRMKCQGGFTMIEAVVLTTALLLLTSIVLPEHIVAMDAAKEDEVKANLHGIQVSLERYATDHGGAYPDYILGGDRQGWDERRGCRAVTMAPMEDMRPPRDALIEGGYLDDYPRNPFLRPGDGVNTVIFKTGASYTLGDGDVRFGWDGERMGNLLDDPRYLFNNGRPTRLEWTMYPIPAAYLGVINPNSPNTYYTFGGLPEWSREENGQSDPAGGKIQYWWPGEFFYRSGGTFVADNPFSGPQEDTGSTIWGWPYKRIDKYMLGGYGSLRSEGLDVIRLTTLDGSAACTQAGTMNGVVEGQYYQDPRDPSRKASHPEFEIQVQYSNPEVFGGGEQGLMPQFPYYQAGNHRWIYGAPDGYPDGIVLVLTNEDRAQE